MSVVHLSPGAAPPAGSRAASEPDIVAHIAARTLGERAAMDFASTAADYDRIRDLIARVVPGFEDMNQRVRQPGGFQLPNPRASAPSSAPRRQGRFLFHPIPHRQTRARRAADDDHPQPRPVQHHRLRDDDRYRGIHGSRRVVPPLSATKPL
jgi:hypothetical protein